MRTLPIIVQHLGDLGEIVGSEHSMPSQAKFSLIQDGGQLPQRMQVID